LEDIEAPLLIKYTCRSNRCLRRFSEIYIPLRKLSINSADPAGSGILRCFVFLLR
jgi:hypothetical protein